ncbi:protein AF-9 isoform X1 [Ornithorhynchus anatinus]|uniref:protein AF-9 isoform X1 n=3 Tax=Ornithorhynchus anatinus TaxID=9258 RepID=UPI0010A8493F|nr:protein AF-9 isoform X1 [Ornithorhynchus anatinus]
MASSCAVQVKLELGHRAQVRKKPTVEGFTHDWMVFVRGPEHSNIQHFVEKVVFHLHESFPRPKRVCKDPPYKVEESGYAGFILPIEVYFKNKEEPKKVRFDYDLFLHLEGHPPVNHLRCEKLTFNNPTEEFRRKLLKAGGREKWRHQALSLPILEPKAFPSAVKKQKWKIMVMSDGTSVPSGQSLNLPSLPSNSLSFSDVKKNKSSHGSKDLNRNIHMNSSSNSFSKPHKLMKEHKEKPSKDSKEHKSAFKEPSREHNKSSKESSKKPKENKPLKEEKIVPKLAFKEPKPMSKESKSENNLLTLTGGQQQDKKAPSKRPSISDSEELTAKKKKKNTSEALFKSFSSAPPLILTCSADKKQIKDKSHVKMSKVKMESEATEKKKSSLPPFDNIVDPNDSDMEENLSSKSEFWSPGKIPWGCPAWLKLKFSEMRSEQPSPTSSGSSSSSSFTPSQTRQQGPLSSIMKDLHSDDNEEETEGEENDNDSEMEKAVNSQGGARSHRVSLSDGSDIESNSTSSPLHHDLPPPLLKANNNQILEVKSPVKPNKSDKSTKNGDCDKAYLDELVELHRRLMTLRERPVLQQIVNLIEETGHFHITNTTFDFDLCSLDKSTVRKLQSYLESSGTS